MIVGGKWSNMRSSRLGSFSPVGARTDHPSIVCAGLKEKYHSVHTSFSKELCEKVWSGVSSWRGGSSVCRGNYRVEGSKSITDTVRKINISAEGNNSTKGQQRDLGILRAPRKLIYIFKSGRLTVDEKHKNFNFIPHPLLPYGIS